MEEAYGGGSALEGSISIQINPSQRHTVSLRPCIKGTQVRRKQSAALRDPRTDEKPGNVEEGKGTTGLTGAAALFSERLRPIEREVKTPKTSDGVYYVLQPTLSQDHGPNHKEKIYNDIRLNYKKDNTKNRVFNFAEAKCIINIPHIVRIQNKSLQSKLRMLESSKAATKKQKSARRQSPDKSKSPRKVTVVEGTPSARSPARSTQSPNRLDVTTPQIGSRAATSSQGNAPEFLSIENSAKSILKNNESSPEPG